VESFEVMMSILGATLIGFMSMSSRAVMLDQSPNRPSMAMVLGWAAM
jgi:hypothetical protein